MNGKLTKFEISRIIGQRAEQIANGAPVFVDYTGLTDAISIAELEFKEQKTPLKVIRTFPDGKQVTIRCGLKL